MPVGGSVDGADDHEYGEHDGGLDSGRRDEGGEHEVDHQETPQDPLGTLAELYHEGQGQTLGKLGLDQHRGQHETQDIQPHHGVTELCQGFLLGCYIEQDDSQDEQKGCQIIRQRFRHPQDQAGNEDCQHRVIRPDETIQSERVQPLLGRGGKACLV